MRPRPCLALDFRCQNGEELGVIHDAKLNTSVNQLSILCWCKIPHMEHSMSTNSRELWMRDIYESNR